MMSYSSAKQRSARSLHILEICPNVGTVVLREVNCARCSQGYSRIPIFRARRLDGIRGSHRQLHVFDVQVRRVQQVHELDDIGLPKLAKQVTGDTEANRSRRPLVIRQFQAACVSTEYRRTRRERRCASQERPSISRLLGMPLSSVPRGTTPLLYLRGMEEITGTSEEFTRRFRTAPYGLC